jgi:hypothetical protein
MNEQYDDLDELPAPPRKDIAPADLELLTLAARALGARFEEVDGEGYGNLHFEDGRVVNAWNPLLFYGDTFELQVRLDLHVSVDLQSAGAVTVEWDFGDSTTPASTVEERSGDEAGDLAATARAVTRAAAEIGKQL